MRSYLYHMRGNRELLDAEPLLAAEGMFVDFGYYVYLTHDDGELFDVAGPFDDELDAEMVRRRAEEWAS